PVHTLPCYRPDQVLRLARLFSIQPEQVHYLASEALIKAIVGQRSVKSAAEVAQIESALEVSARMHRLAMDLTRPGLYERQVVAQVEALARAEGLDLAFPTIFSVRGEILHNPYHDNLMQAGQMAVHDSGAESSLRYASDITRTIPVSGRFDTRQRELYQIVLRAQKLTIAAIRPQVEFRAIHRLACRTLLEGLRDIGLVRGDLDQALEAGVHTLFFQCGLGHMLGLDVHDMEALGEDFVGYTDQIRRNPAFGWKSLRLARPLEAGFVLTVEPGIYLIDQLIEQFAAEGRFRDFVDYRRLESYRGIGGIRIEDDVLVTPEGCRVLGPAIPREVDEIESR
ncbi:MAG: M24B family metallopeptidase, partial [Sedimentisphaerales bacterium]|nr:M24B family metallopeptidase [Sedimentisphaerales bacterium]